MLKVSRKVKRAFLIRNRSGTEARFKQLKIVKKHHFVFIISAVLFLNLKNTHRKHMEIWNEGLQVIIGKIFLPHEAKTIAISKLEDMELVLCHEKHAISRKDGGRKEAVALFTGLQNGPEHALPHI